MSEENVELILRSIAAFEGDEETWLAAVDPSHVWLHLTGTGKGSGVEVDLALQAAGLSE